MLCGSPLQGHSLALKSLATIQNGLESPLSHDGSATCSSVYFPTFGTKIVIAGVKNDLNLWNSCLCLSFCPSSLQPGCSYWSNLTSTTQLRLHSANPTRSSFKFEDFRGTHSCLCSLQENQAEGSPTRLGREKRHVLELNVVPRSRGEHGRRHGEGSALRSMGAEGTPSGSKGTAEQQEMEIRVCTNRTCRKEGALQALEYFKGMAPPHVTVETCGCLGNCGMGPNAVLLPHELFIRHCNTAPHVARLLEIQCGASGPENNLRALDLKSRGNDAFGRNDAALAERLFTEAIELAPSGGLHNIYANRSAARVALRNASGALQDALEAERLKPGWSGALVRQAEAHAAGGSLQAALDMYARAVQMDAELRRSKSIQRKVRELKMALSPIAAKN
eukprot:jgi/Mesen1/5513/ME000279S04724